MRGLWLDDGSLTYREDIPTPTAVAGECIVRVRQAGICSTDIAMLNGLYPFTGVLGHEFVGVVEDGPNTLAGRRVVGEINSCCGTCAYCRSSLRKHCPNRSVIGIVGRDGAFADCICLPEENLHVVPNVVPDRAAVFVEPLAAALDILERVEIGAADKVLLVGAGKLGQLVARVVATTGCSLDIVVRSASKAGRLKDLPTTMISAADIVAQDYDVAIECTGNEGGFQAALGGLRPQGTLAMKSTFPGLVSVDITKIVVDEIRLIGSRCGPYDKALALLEAGKVDPQALIDAVYPLSEGLSGIAQSQEPGILKVLLDFDGATHGN